MAEKVKGELRVIKKNDFGFWSVKIDETWYGLGTKKELVGLERGDYVEGEYELEKGKYKTITKAGLSKAQGTDVKTGTPTGGSTAGADDKMSKGEWAMKDQRIQYQHAQKVAATLIANPAILAAAGVDKAKPADKLGIIEAIFDRYTASVFTDVGNFGAVARVNAPVVDPAAPPTDDSDDE
jgi:hypothetical protein